MGNNKSIFLSLLGIIILSMFFGYSLVFAGTGNVVFDNKQIATSLMFKLSKNIYLDSVLLRNNKILIKSGEDLTGGKILSNSCDMFSKLSNHKGNFYLFEIKFFDNKCRDESFKLVNNNGDIKLNFELDLISDYVILSSLLDLNTDNLVELRGILNKKESKYLIYEKYDKKEESNYYKYLKYNRTLKETIYRKNIVENILEKRSEKYIVPVLGHSLPNKYVKIPNSGRGYRKGFTDGIHHGWDIDGEFGEQTVALDDGIIIRDVSEFDFSDLNKIKKSNYLTEDEKLRNLDILRGKQVWLKTMKGEVVFYSHLDEVFSNIKTGEIVRKGQPIGTIGITGVPDEEYKDFHVHFPIHVNPFIKGKEGKYSYDEYMKWDWLFKGETGDFILENQNKIFEEYKG